MDERCRRSFCICLLLLSATGCVQTQYLANEVPRQFAARPIRNFATVDFTPYATSIVDADTIQPGDQLSVTLDTGTHLGDSSLDWSVSVDEQGETSLPNIGAVQLAGLTRSQAEKQIVTASQQRDVFLTPTVEVTVRDSEQQTIHVRGAVSEPGPIVVRGGQVTVADVLARAGGLTRDASGRISVSQGADRPVTGTIRQVGAESSGTQAIQVSLENTSVEELSLMKISDGAVVHVEATPPRPIKVVGVIQNQVVEVPSGLNVRLLDALTLAGGQTYSNWISDKVTIIRRVPNRDETIRIKASIRRAKNDDAENLLLAPYDIVSVEENLVTFTLSTLSGLFGAGVSAAQIGAF